MQYLPRDSALSREIVPPTDAERWTGGDATASILADLFDLVNLMRSEANARGSGKKPRHTKPYPRPGVTPKGTQHIGKDPIPVSEFEDWWESKKQGR